MSPYAGLSGVKADAVVRLDIGARIGRWLTLRNREWYKFRWLGMQAGRTNDGLKLH